MIHKRTTNTDSFQTHYNMIIITKLYGLEPLQQMNFLNDAHDLS